MLIRPKSQEAISADISFVAGGKRRGFCRLLGGKVFWEVPVWSRTGTVWTTTGD
jgi:hypothetical protein